MSPKMARVTFSPILGDISGSIGSLTFQKNRFGSTLRTKPIPLRLSSQSQQSSRLMVALVLKTWQSLSDSLRAQWNNFLNFSPAYCKRNKNVQLSGYLLFLKYNLIRLQAGMSLLTTFSYTPLVYLNPICRIGSTGNVVNLYLYDYYDPAVSFFLFKVSTPLARSYAFNLSQLRVCNVGALEYYWFPLGTKYLAKFGQIPHENDFLNYELTRFSVVAPIIAAPFSSQLKVSAVF